MRSNTIIYFRPTICFNTGKAVVPVFREEGDFNWTTYGFSDTKENKNAGLKFGTEFETPHFSA